MLSSDIAHSECWQRFRLDSEMSCAPIAAHTVRDSAFAFSLRSQASFREKLRQVPRNTATNKDKSKYKPKQKGRLARRPFAEIGRIRGKLNRSN
jgi:hypothetical protein